MALLMIVLSIFLAQTAHAAEFGCETGPSPAMSQYPNLNEECYVNGTTLSVRGLIDGKLLRELVNNDNLKTVELHSLGGSIPVAQQAARLIRQRGLTTVIGENAICASSCTLVYQAGVQRIAAASGRFYYHCVGFMDEWEKGQLVSSCGGDPKSYSIDCANRLQSMIDSSVSSTKDYLTQNQQAYGASPGLSAMLFSQPDDPNWFTDSNFCKKAAWVSADSALGLGVVLSVVPHD